MSVTDLLEDLGRLSSDPYRFVLWAFPWNEPGSELEGVSGPETWQADLLKDVRDGLLTLDGALRFATVSGRGIGKSALVSWLILWAISTLEDTRGVVTANTEVQLKTKTWAELGKWYRMFIGREMFRLTATSLSSKDPGHELTWRIDLVPWSENNPAAFQGLHNFGRRFIIIFDEASQIADPIWEAAEGSMTDARTQMIWAVFGNPNKNSGRFKDCFDRFKHRWNTRQIDSRSVTISDKREIQNAIDDWGEDTDFVRVHYLGQFPRVGLTEFISMSIVEEAMSRDLMLPEPYEPLIIGVDVARFGDDKSVIFFRRGRDARSIPPQRYSGIDTTELAMRVSEAYILHRADAVFVDETGGYGGGVVDQLRNHFRVPCIGVQFSGKPDRLALQGDTSKYANKRAEIWGFMRAWLKGGYLPRGDDLKRELAGPMYGFNKKDEILLEKKEDMKKRGLPSPDLGDALALTFAYPVAPNFSREREGENVLVDYDPYAALEAA